MLFIYIVISQKIQNLSFFKLKTLSNYKKTLQKIVQKISALFSEAFTPQKPSEHFFYVPYRIKLPSFFSLTSLVKCPKQATYTKLKVVSLDLYIFLKYIKIIIRKLIC